MVLAISAGVIGLIIALFGVSDLWNLFHSRGWMRLKRVCQVVGKYFSFLFILFLTVLVSFVSCSHELFSTRLSCGE